MGTLDWATIGFVILFLLFNLVIVLRISYLEDKMDEMADLIVCLKIYNSKLVSKEMKESKTVIIKDQDGKNIEIEI